MLIKKFCLAVFFLCALQTASAKSLDVESTVKDWDLPKLNSVSTTLPKQMIKEITLSPYIFMSQNDFNRDGTMEHIVGANCIEGFCVNFIFKVLKNHRYQYLGYAAFHQKHYELVWEKANIMPAIVYFEQTNVGQGCMGRYEYERNVGYKRVVEVCRLPKEVMDVVSTHANIQYEAEQPDVEVNNKSNKDLDFIDMSDIKYDDNPEDFFPETKK